MPADQLTVPADPSPFRFEPADTALVIIDMQRDFVEPGGFGETLGNDVTQSRDARLSPRHFSAQVIQPQ